EPPPMPRKRPRRRRWWFVSLALLAIVALWLLPTILARTPLLGWAVHAATSDLHGRLTVRAASLGWFSPVRLSGVTVVDPEDRPVLEVQRIETERSLLGLATASDRPGLVRAVGPKIVLTLRPDGSNVEDVLAEYLKPAEETAPLPRIQLQVVDGRVTVTDAARGRTWQIRDWQLTLDLPAAALTAAQRPTSVTTSAKVDDPKRRGRFGFSGSAPLAAWAALIGGPVEEVSEVVALPPSTAEVSAEGVPLTMFQPLLRRLWPDATLGGVLDGTFSAALGTAASTPGTVRAALTATGFRLAGLPPRTPRIRPQTRVTAGRVQVAAELDVSARAVHLRRSEIHVQPLRLSVAGVNINEPHVGLTAEGAFDGHAQAVTIDRYALQSETLDSQGRGTLTLAGEPAEIDFQGRLQYDMAQISSLLEPHVGQGVTLAGEGDTPVSLRGPIDLQRLQGAAELSWDRGEVYGFRLGPARVKTLLRDGVLRLEPVTVGVNRGQARLQPRLRLTPAPMLLEHPKEDLITKVEITPQMCAGALKFIAPVLAGVTSADGQFSIELDRCRVPLDQPEKGEVAGRLIVHTVRVGPGPLTRALAAALGRGGSARLERESVIPFRMAGGRVHHENLGLVFPEVTLRTAGSVGFDQSLKLVVEMPIPERWLPKAGAGPLRDVLGAALRDQTVSVAIGGTLYSPKIDRAGLRGLNRQFLQRASRNVIEDRIDRGLKQLFAPPTE
ncbi:MAG: hypothetical protein ACOC46_02240, partial [Pirellulales bacterium]